jgi:hypothetical protein
MFIYLLFLAQDGLVSLWQNEETEELYIAVGNLKVEKPNDQPDKQNPTPKAPEAAQTMLPETAETTVDTNERKLHTLNLLEAALYVAGRPLDINEMCQAVGSRSKKRVMGYAETLWNNTKPQQPHGNTGTKRRTLRVAG